MKRKFLCTLSLMLLMTQPLSAASLSTAVDGKIIENGAAVTENGITYISVRPIAEALGLNVDWTAETKTVTISNGGPLYITFKIGQNGYTFAKTAPLSLSAAPIIINSSAYVPVDVVTELLNYEIQTENNVLNIITEENINIEDETATGSGIVTEINENEILFNDDVKGEIILNANDDTIIAYESGEAADISAVTVNSRLIVEYGSEMTMSIPPVNNPVSITIAE